MTTEEMKNRIAELEAQNLDMEIRLEADKIIFKQERTRVHMLEEALEVTQGNLEQTLGTIRTLKEHEMELSEKVTDLVCKLDSFETYLKNEKETAYENWKAEEESIKVQLIFFDAYEIYSDALSRFRSM